MVGSATCHSNAMPTSKDLRRKLKAFARRRPQRQPESASDLLRKPGASSGAACDVGGLLVTTILEFAEGHPGLRDAIVLAALRACYSGTEPNNDPSRQLSKTLDDIPTRYAVSLGSFRTELGALLSLCQQHRQSAQADSFVQFLRALTQ